MVLLGVKKENGWLKSSWQSTYGMSWENILHAINSLFDYYTQREIILDEDSVEVSGKDDIYRLEERNRIVIRGISTIIKVPIMITFYNQLRRVDAYVQCTTREFEEADYQKFNLSLGQYMDSIELAMFCNRGQRQSSGIQKTKSKIKNFFGLR